MIDENMEKQLFGEKKFKEGYDWAKQELGWQPISSAPKDGTIIDLYTVQNERWTDMNWDDVAERWESILHSGFLREKYATHWMPVPTYPANSGAHLNTEAEK